MHESLKKLAIPVLHYLFRGRTGASGLLGYLRPAIEQKDRVICGIFIQRRFWSGRMASFACIASDIGTLF